MTSSLGSPPRTTSSPPPPRSSLHPQRTPAPAGLDRTHESNTCSIDCSLTGASDNAQGDRPRRAFAGSHHHAIHHHAIRRAPARLPCRPECPSSPGVLARAPPTSRRPQALRATWPRPCAGPTRPQRRQRAHNAVRAPPRPNRPPQPAAPTGRAPHRPAPEPALRSRTRARCPSGCRRPAAWPWTGSSCRSAAPAPPRPTAAPPARWRSPPPPSAGPPGRRPAAPTG